MPISPHGDGTLVDLRCAEPERDELRRGDLGEERLGEPSGVLLDVGRVDGLDDLREVDGAHAAGAEHTGDDVTPEGRARLRGRRRSGGHSQPAGDLRLPTRRGRGATRVRVDDPVATRSVFALHNTLTNEASVLEWESCFMATLARAKLYDSVAGRRRFSDWPTSSTSVFLSRAK